MAESNFYVFRRYAQEEGGDEGYFYRDTSRTLRYVPLTEEDRKEYEDRSNISQKIASRIAGIAVREAGYTDEDARRAAKDVKQRFMAYRSIDAQRVKNVEYSTAPGIAASWRASEQTLLLSRDGLRDLDTIDHEMAHVLQDAYGYRKDYVTVHYPTGHTEKELIRYGTPGESVLPLNALREESTTVKKVIWDDYFAKRYGEFQAELFMVAKNYPRLVADDLKNDDRQGYLRKEVAQFEEWGYHLKTPPKLTRKTPRKSASIDVPLKAKKLDKGSYRREIERLLSTLARLADVPVTGIAERADGGKLLFYPFSEKGGELRGLLQKEVKTEKDEEVWELFKTLQSTLAQYNYFLKEEFPEAGMTAFTKEQSKRLAPKDYAT